MKDITTKIIYFNKEGKINTDKTIKASLKRAKELGIKQIVVASTTGDTGRKIAEAFKGYTTVTVTHSAGFHSPNNQSLTESNRKAILSKGGKILTCQHAFGGIGRAVRKKMETYQLEEIIAYTLRIFGQGTKVACEITLMAADAGLINTNHDVIAIGGSGKGADTAIVIQPVTAQNFFDMKIKEFICKPHLG